MIMKHKKHLDAHKIIFEISTNITIHRNCNPRDDTFYIFFHFN